MASSPGEVVYCLCQQPNDESQFMIQCDVCNDWFHGKCVGIQEYQAGDVEKFHCPSCQEVHGPLILKQRRNWHRHDYSEDANISATQSGSVTFINELKSRTFLSAESIVVHLKGHQLTLEYFEKRGFKEPIIVETSCGLDLIVPPPTFGVDDVELHVGSMREIDVIDVARQSDVKMLLREWVEYFNCKHKTRVLNVISLEFSNTKLAELVSPPRIVTQLSWVSNFWPAQSATDDTGSNGGCHRKPEVQKYCLMSVKDSYTDFHIDFGGTSVWYHILWGEKVFYLIEPTSEALDKYEAWASTPNQSEVFLGDRVERCYRLVLTKGQTLFIPTGWIHAVYTPVDSLVFGGNFLHSLNAGLQLRVYDIEYRIQTPMRFRFPNFETTCWYAARHLADTLKELAEDAKKPLQYLCKSAKDLLSALKAWTQAKDQMLLRQHREAVPEGLSSGKVLRDLAQALAAVQSMGGRKKERQALSGSAASSNKRRRRTSSSSGSSTKKDKLTIDLDVLEQHTHKALKDNVETTALMTKVPKLTIAEKGSSSQAKSPSGRYTVDWPDSEEATTEHMSSDDSNSPAKPNSTALKLKLSFGGKSAGTDARVASGWGKVKVEAASVTTKLPTVPKDAKFASWFTSSAAGKPMQAGAKELSSQPMALGSAGAVPAASPQHAADALLQWPVTAHGVRERGSARSDIHGVAPTEPELRSRIGAEVADSASVNRTQRMLPSQERNRWLAGGGASAKTSESKREAEVTGDVIGQLLPSIAHTGLTRRMAVAESSTAGKACYTKDDFVYPSAADSDADDSDTAFTNAKKRVRKRQGKNDDAWHPSTKVRPTIGVGQEPLATTRPQRPSRAPAAGREKVRWPGAGSEDDGDSSTAEEEQVAVGSAAPALTAAAMTAAAAPGLHTKETASVRKSRESTTSADCHYITAAFHKTQAPAIVAAKKSRKGLATAKQRLGKKLKLGQLMHN